MAVIRELKLTAVITDNISMILPRPSFIYVLIFLTFFSSLLTAQDKEKKDAQTRGIGMSQSDVLELMVDRIDGFDERITACQDPGRDSTKISFHKCLWEGDAKINLGALPPEEKKAITDYLEFKKNEKDERPEMSDTPLQMTEHIAAEKDSATVKLEEYFSKKLTQALYGDVKKDLTKQVGKEIDKKKHKIVDQRVYHDIYENLVSKKVVSDISSYCVRVDYSDDLYLLASDEKKAIETNKDKLTGDVQKHYGQWNTCFSKLETTCYEGEFLCEDFDQDKEPLKYNDCKERLNKSRTKSCMVMRSVRSARQALISNKHIMETYDDPDQMSGSIALGHSNSDEVEVGIYDPNDKEVSPDRVTTFSSGEIISEANEFSEANQEEIDKMAECYRPGTEDDQPGEIIDPEACEEFLASNRNEQYRAVAEVSARTRAVSQQIENMEEEDDVKKFLEQEGRSDDEIEALLEQYGNIKDIKDEINNHYQKEQEALIAQMTDLIDDTTTAGPEGVDPNKDLSTIRKLHEELTSREEVFKQTVHYNNVMASFLTIGDPNNEDEEGSRNTGMVIQEMNNSAFSPDANVDPKDAQNNADYFDSLTATLEETKSLEASDNDATNVLLDVSKINESILKYKRQPAGEKTN